jgi:site-specific DNA-methyltransferase (adenine-specific)
LNDKSVGRTESEQAANTIYWGDCIEVLSSFPEGSADMIYLDPPFFSQKNYEILGKGRVREAGFEDTWKNGIKSYLDWMEPRVRQCFRLLRNTGSLYLHCNSFANAHLRLMADEIFSTDIRCEIIWDKGFRGTERRRNWQQSHDTILFYTKSADYVWNNQHQSYADAKLNRYNKTDSRGNKFAFIKRRHTDGTIYYGKTYPKIEGKKMNDIIRIPLLSATSKERLGYPTQKPEALLETLIGSSTNPGDLVLDPVCGSGTTAAVAHRMGRKWVAIDSSKKACTLTKTRLQNISVSREIKIMKFSEGHGIEETE